jgi:hypothetical protein
MPRNFREVMIGDWGLRTDEYDECDERKELYARTLVS